MILELLCNQLNREDVCPLVFLEYLSQLKDDEFEGYPGITYENGREHLQYRVGSEEFYAIELKDSGKVIGNR